MVKTLVLPTQGVLVQSLVQELRSHRPHGVAKNLKEKKSSYHNLSNQCWTRRLVSTSIIGLIVQNSHRKEHIRMQLPSPILESGHLKEKFLWNYPVTQGREFLAPLTWFRYTQNVNRTCKEYPQTLIGSLWGVLEKARDARRWVDFKPISKNWDKRQIPIPAYLKLGKTFWEDY